MGKDYKVRLEFEIEADSPEEAALKATKRAKEGAIKEASVFWYPRSFKKIDLESLPK